MHHLKTSLSILFGLCFFYAQAQLTFYADQSSSYPKTANDILEAYKEHAEISPDEVIDLVFAMAGTTHYASGLQHPIIKYSYKSNDKFAVEWSVDQDYTGSEVALLNLKTGQFVREFVSKPTWKMDYFDSNIHLLIIKNEYRTISHGSIAFIGDDKIMSLQEKDTRCDCKNKWGTIFSSANEFQVPEGSQNQVIHTHTWNNLMNTGATYSYRLSFDTQTSAPKILSFDVSFSTPPTVSIDSDCNSEYEGPTVTPNNGLFYFSLPNTSVQILLGVNELKIVQNSGTMIYGIRIERCERNNVGRPVISDQASLIVELQQNSVQKEIILTMAASELTTMTKAQAKVSIHSMNGQFNELLGNYPLSEAKLEQRFDLTHLPNGMYILSIQGINTKEHRKIILHD